MPSSHFYIIGQVITSMKNVRQDKGRILWKNIMGAYDGNIKSIWIMKDKQQWVSWKIGENYMKKEQHMKSSWKRKVHDILEELNTIWLEHREEGQRKVLGLDGEDAGTD